MTGLFILVLLFVVLPIILGFFSRRRRPSLFDILTNASPTTGYGTGRRRRLDPGIESNRLTCPACGATNFPTEAVCWQCQRPLDQVRVARRAFGEGRVSSTSFQVSQVTYNGDTAIQFTDSRGRRHIFRSWDQAPKAVLDEIERMPEPMRSHVRAQMAEPGAASPVRPPILPAPGAAGRPAPSVPPKPAGTPAEEPGGAAKPDQSEAKKGEQQKPPDEEAPWIEL